MVFIPYLLSDVCKKPYLSVLFHIKFKKRYYLSTYYVLNGAEATEKEKGISE